MDLSPAYWQYRRRDELTEGNRQKQPFGGSDAHCEEYRWFGRFVKRDRDCPIVELAQLAVSRAKTGLTLTQTVDPSDTEVA